MWLATCKCVGCYDLKLPWCMQGVCLWIGTIMQLGLVCIYCGDSFLYKIRYWFRYLNLFVSDTQCLSCVMLPWIWSMYAWMLIVCVVVSFSGDRIERWLCGGGWSVWVSGGGWSGTSQPRQAIYLLHIWILLSHYALFYSCFHHYALFFLYCYYSLNSNSWRLSSTSRFVIIYEGWHL
jgi:hypothetical protein